ncbi:MAG: recombinase family protein [Planctomycetota bacterium]
MWWAQKSDTVASKRAVAYYRHSAQDRQENSIPIQQEQVREFAQKNGMRIIKEFMDQGKSGLSTEGRDGFNEMIEQYVVGGKDSFEYILVLDVSRWGRFQDTDLSAYYTGLCMKYGIQVIYTTMGFPKEDGLIHTLQLNIERYHAASYSKELSGKVFRGCAKIAILAGLVRVYERYGKMGPRQIAAAAELPSASTYHHRFPSVEMALQRHKYGEVLDRVKDAVMDEFRARAHRVDEFDDYVVLNESFSVLIQPSIPLVFGGRSFWPFRPDRRVDIDITLGVSLGLDPPHPVMGYFIFPRLLVKRAPFKLCDTSRSVLEMFGYTTSDFLIPIRNRACFSEKGLALFPTHR